MRLSFPDPDDSLGSYYTSTVRRIDGRGVLIDVPRHEDRDLMLTNGSEVVLFSQYHGRTYRYTARVLEAGLQVLLEEPSEAKKMERRAFYRLLITIPVVQAELIEEEGAGEPIEATIVDLSGGGVRLRVDRTLSAGTRLELVFDLRDRRLRLEAEIIHLAELERARGTRYEAQCRFLEISKIDQDTIVRFIFEKQREFSQKGVA